ncbi:SOS response-associated peptidase family protein [Bifidobacterium gallicum]|uniref:Abasic site processing protein n=1 Tax=Bifidobacterium gallicum DSM 20093 = LMG 11596 TaxID=561180 RepID=D1NW46_9BIFI|nr:SOS response-associated peptidase family protein [Bifidobacterium gallicum]EFA22332.1 hypothetical protein BIFGAL_04091 [Bifidobacterium gallicum DSM 20093 = LMG 11596]KFI60047.1 putative product YoaM [Bifidobacterium gallicum DSM 20093 = LMG 11596]
MCARYEALTIEHVQAVIAQLTGIEKADPAQAAPEPAAEPELEFESEPAQLDLFAAAEHGSQPQLERPQTREPVDVYPSAVTPVIVPTFDTAVGDGALEFADELAFESPGQPAPGTAPSQRNLAHASTHALDSGHPLLPPHSLRAERLSWGCEAPWLKQPVFNTRIESAEKPFWRQSMEHDRCIIACRKFYEYGPAPEPGARKPQYVFTVPHMHVIFVGAVRKGGAFSMITTAANGIMAPIHARMPLVLHPRELDLWLGPDYRALADRSRVPLNVSPVRPLT